MDIEYITLLSQILEEIPGATREEVIDFVRNEVGVEEGDAYSEEIRETFLKNLERMTDEEYAKIDLDLAVGLEDNLDE